MSERRSLEDRFWSRVNKDGPVLGKRNAPGPCWIWSGYRCSDGYGKVWAQIGGKAKVHGAHRVAYFLEVGRLPASVCMHRCDNPSCVNPSHLKEGSHRDNVRDAVTKGRRSVKLTHALVFEIKSLLDNDLTVAQIAARFGVSPRTISKIEAGEIWAHVTC